MVIFGGWMNVLINTNGLQVYTVAKITNNLI